MALKDRIALKGEPLYLIDGNAFAYRAFYAFPDLTRSDGKPTNALYIILRLIFRMLREESPAYVGFFLDGRGPTYRNELLPEYKANRQAMPESLSAQFPLIMEAVKLLGLSLTVSEGGEADDCICSLARRNRDDRTVVIVGADKDLNQCLGENVYIWDPGLKTEKLLGVGDFTAEFGIPPERWPDYQALIGDSSDNIPGVPGVGPKTALKVMARLPSLEAIRDNLDELTPAERKKIEPFVDKTFTYRLVARLQEDLCPDLSLDKLRRAPVDLPALKAFLLEWELRSLAAEADKLFGGQPSPSKPQAAPEKTPQAARKTAKPKAQPLSLLSPPAPRSEVPAESLPVLSAAELPDPSGKPVGLLLKEGGYFVGLDGIDAHIPADQAALLAARLATASLVAVDDYKALLSRDPQAWSAVPLANVFDLGLAAYLLSPEERNYGWERLKLVLASDIENGSGNLAHQQAPCATSGHGLLALCLAQGLEKRLEETGLTTLMRELETPLIPVLARMERLGARIDLEAFSGFLSEVQTRLDELSRSVQAHAGREFNLRSSRQLAEALYGVLGLSPDQNGGAAKSKSAKPKKTPTGEISTSAESLEKLRHAHPVVDEILEWRKLEKLRSTYLEPLPRLADGQGRIHTTFNQLTTATGRLSSSNPNLQNIPIRGEMGQRMRACFIAAEGCELVSADYSQIELRILAHLSRDPELMRAFHERQDIHSRTAALIFDKTPETVSPDERRSAKTINFGLLYGMGPQKLAQELGVTMATAKDFIARYFEKLGTLKAFYEAILADARNRGYVTTIFGRRRPLPDIASRNENLAQIARRQAINTRVQGSAADVIKKAMLDVDADPQLASLNARLILQIHDELLLEVPAKSASQAAARLTSLMTGVITLDVPLEADSGHGASWADAHG